ncbi:MAG TPA: alpha/beta fold hydrolase [Gammaproteobacteria bacterium]|nr:alpha/beta fold hydrolase [Gammaproteobacteria bacterium]
MTQVSDASHSRLPLYSDPTVSLSNRGNRFLIPGAEPGWVLEAQLDTAKTPRSADTPVAVVCHPHPLHGGTFTNKVAHMVAKAFVELGAETLRFNFRGVGQSSGAFDHGAGEICDLQAAVDWLRARHPAAPLWLAGFSFGAFVALSAQAQLKAARLLLVAPPVAMFDFPVESGVTVPWLVIQGSVDEIVDPALVSAWVEQQASAPEYRCLEGAGHFFHGRLIDLRQQICAAWAGENCPME